MRKKIICVIGGGACGTAAFIQLVVKLVTTDKAQSTRIILLEKDHVIGEGLAFGTRERGHLLNTAAALMGIHEHEPEQYSDWLSQNRHRVDDELVNSYDEADDAYTTRRLYSEYLKEQFSTYLSLANSNDLEVEIRYDEAIDITPAGSGYQVKLLQSNVIHADFVLMFPGTPVSTNYDQFADVPQYADLPWPSAPLHAIPADASVGILGTGLSAVDAVMTLVDNDHRGKIMLFSPDGTLPRVQPRTESGYACSHLTVGNIHSILRSRLDSPTALDLLRLFRKEIEAYDKYFNKSPVFDRRGMTAAELLDADIGIALKGGDASLNIMYGLRFSASPIWMLLSADEKQRFKRRFGTMYANNRHAMPLHNAFRLQHHFRRGILNVYGGLRNVAWQAESATFGIHAAGEQVQTEYLINATGPGVVLGEMKSTLVRNLLSSGMIIPYPVGGLEVNPVSMQVKSRLSHGDGFYCAGHVCNGVLLDVNSVWFNVRSIGRLTDHVLQRI